MSGKQTTAAVLLLLLLVVYLLSGCSTHASKFICGCDCNTTTFKCSTTSDRLETDLN